MNNVNEYELLDILLGKYKSIVVDQKDKDRPFLDKMANEGYLVNYDNSFEGVKYYHVKEKFRNKILEIMRNK